MAAFDPSPIAVRLRRIRGHLDAIMTMISEGRNCLELAQQLHAVERAAAATKRELIYGRIEACLAAAAISPAEARPLLSEIKILGKYL
jgi:uncharacterized protein